MKISKLLIITGVILVAIAVALINPYIVMATGAIMMIVGYIRKRKKRQAINN